MSTENEFITQHYVKIRFSQILCFFRKTVFLSFIVSMLLLLVKLPLAGLAALYACLLIDDIPEQLPRLFLMLAILGQCYVLSCMLLPPILYPFISVLISSYITISAALSVYVTVSVTDQISEPIAPPTSRELFQQCNDNVDKLLSNMDVSPYVQGNAPQS